MTPTLVANDSRAAEADRTELEGARHLESEAS
jgi:hypothetical protein